jgi:DNA-3-methyladenine glycosylase I
MDAKAAKSVRAKKPAPADKSAPPDISRCGWARNDLAIRYHDEEWGVPLHDDVAWFEALILDGAQAGLSWDTILRKRENYRKAFKGFDPVKVAKFGERDVARLLADEGIVRNRLKVASAITNAKSFLAVQKEFGSFDAYIWKFAGPSPRINSWSQTKHVPARTPESDALSKDLIARGFKFVGSTICYALMQATGLVNDHMVECFRYRTASSLRR